MNAAHHTPEVLTLSIRLPESSRKQHLH